MSLELLLCAAEFIESQETVDGDDSKSNNLESKIYSSNIKTESSALTTTPVKNFYEKSSSVTLDNDHSQSLISGDPTHEKKITLSTVSKDAIDTLSPQHHLQPQRIISPTAPNRRGLATQHHHSATGINSLSAGTLRSSSSFSQDSFSISSLSPSNSSSSGGEVSPMGLVSAFRNSPGCETALLSHSRTPMESTLSHSPSESNTQYSLNGFIRPNGLSKVGNDQEDDEANANAKDDPGKKRAGSTPSREVHNKLEKNRRAHLKECFETLRRQLPSMEDKKISNQTILKAAHRYIQQLKRKEKEFEHELERLARGKIAHQQQIASLKKELQTKWDHIDFSIILSDMSSLELHKERETKSTTTAPEHPDLEDDSRESLKLSNTLPHLPPEASYGAVDLTPTSSNSDRALVHHQVDREIYQDPNQPLNLSTNTMDSKSNHKLPSPNPHFRANGDWSTGRGPQYCPSNKTTITNEKPSLSVVSPSLSHSPTRKTGTAPVGSILNKSLNSNIGGYNKVSPASTVSTNTPHITDYATPSTVSMGNPVTHISQLVKAGTTVSHLPSVTKVTTLSHGSTVSPAVSNLSISHPSNLTYIQNVTAVAVPQDATFATNVSSGAVSHSPNGSAIGRSTSCTVTSNATTITVPSTEHTIPIVSGSGIQLPGHLVANGVHLSGAAGGIIGQPAIHLITPEGGYKLLPADHSSNGVKPVAFALAQSGLEHLSSVEDGKHGPVIVPLNKNGLSALHLTVPASARAINSSTTGSSVPVVPVTSVPLNLAVHGSGTTVKVSQAGSPPIIPSYIPITHPNGLTRLVQGMSVVGPLVVSQSQRVVLPTNITTSANKVLKNQGPSTSGTATLPLAQYASALTGGLLNSVVVVSASPSSTAPAVTTSVGLSTAKN